mmetsp:Transcript_40401/g.114389  ORF Transcript_40401/g.114389 Transcript_40401/m.114389 type:complete len:263 (-) Transcript_40401:1861-2649(-)
MSPASTTASTPHAAASTMSQGSLNGEGPAAGVASWPACPASRGRTGAPEAAAEGRGRGAGLSRHTPPCILKLGRQSSQRGPVWPKGHCTSSAAQSREHRPLNTVSPAAHSSHMAPVYPAKHSHDPVAWAQTPCRHLLHLVGESSKGQSLGQAFGDSAPAKSDSPTSQRPLPHTPERLEEVMLWAAKSALPLTLRDRSRTMPSADGPLPPKAALSMYTANSAVARRIPPLAACAGSSILISSTVTAARLAPRVSSPEAASTAR